MLNSAHDAYLENRILSADPLELVRILYQEGIGAVLEARRHLAQGKIVERAQSINRACEILIELNASLDCERGGAISTGLGDLYPYMLRRLMEANFHQSDPPLAEVLKLFTTLAEAWEGIRKPAPASAPAKSWSAPAEPVYAGSSQAWSL